MENTERRFVSGTSMLLKNNPLDALYYSSQPRFRSCQKALPWLRSMLCVNVQGVNIILLPACTSSLLICSHTGKLSCSELNQDSGISISSACQSLNLNILRETGLKTRPRCVQASLGSIQTEQFSDPWQSFYSRIPAMLFVLFWDLK